MRGNVYDIELELPGEAHSNLGHHAFSVACEEYTRANGAAVLISTTTGGRNQVRPPFAFYLDDPALYVREHGRPFDASRPITPTLLATVGMRALPGRVGHVGEGFFTGTGCRRGFGANDAIVVQLQLPSRMQALAKLYPRPRDIAGQSLERKPLAERLSVWTGSGDSSLWVVVSNDKYNAITGFVQCLELRHEAVPYPQTSLELCDTTLARQLHLGSVVSMLSRLCASAETAKVLESQVGRIIGSGASKVDRHLQAIFGLC